MPISNNRQLLLRCPNCKNTMKYMTQKAGDTILGKQKVCVYCGKSFSVRNNILTKTH